MQTKTFFLFLLLCTLAGCKDDPKPKTELERLPPATQEGKNTFGCLMNGKAWVTRTSIDATAFYQEGVLSISAGAITSDWDQGIGFILEDGDLSEKDYQLNEPILRYAELGDKTLKCIFKTNSDTYTGSLTITHLDQINLVVSGTFEFSAYSAECKESIKVTDGRFDLMYAN